MTVKTNPAGQTCSVANGSGTVGSSDITNIAVTCAAAATHQVGGTVSGLSGTVVLQDNGGDDQRQRERRVHLRHRARGGLGLRRDGEDQPGRADLLGGQQIGAVGSSDITNIAVTCAAAVTHQVGGTVSGLSGTVVLQDNGGDDLSVSASGGVHLRPPQLASGLGLRRDGEDQPGRADLHEVANGSGTVGSVGHHQHRRHLHDKCCGQRPV